MARSTKRYELKEFNQVYVEAYLDVRETSLCIWDTVIYILRRCMQPVRLC